jgi:hypothetical protein
VVLTLRVRKEEGSLGSITRSVMTTLDDCFG